MIHLMMNTRDQRLGAADETRPRVLGLYLRSLRLAVLVGNAAVVLIVVVQAVADHVANPVSTLRQVRADKAATPSARPGQKESA